MAAGHRFATLDGLRGFAAISVMFYHSGEANFLMAGTHPLPSAYLAVDLFFVLSGFVLAHSYEKRFAAGMTTAEFMAARIIRLYPLYLLGLAITIAMIVAAGPFSRGRIALSLLFVPLLCSGCMLYPLNVPAWSLLFEMIANFVYRAVFRFLNSTLSVFRFWVCASPRWATAREQIFSFPICAGSGFPSLRA